MENNNLRNELKSIYKTLNNTNSEAFKDTLIERINELIEQNTND